MTPANISEPWYSDTGDQIPQNIHNQLARHCWTLGFVITGVVTLISALVSVMTAAISLSKSIQNAKCISDLTQNTSKALQSCKY